MLPMGSWDTLPVGIELKSPSAFAFLVSLDGFFGYLESPEVCSCCALFDLNLQALFVNVYLPQV